MSLNVRRTDTDTRPGQYFGKPAVLNEISELDARLQRRVDQLFEQGFERYARERVNRITSDDEQPRPRNPGHDSGHGLNQLSHAFGFAKRAGEDNQPFFFVDVGPWFEPLSVYKSRQNLNRTIAELQHFSRRLGHEFADRAQFVGARE